MADEEDAKAGTLPPGHAPQPGRPIAISGGSLGDGMPGDNMAVTPDGRTLFATVATTNIARVDLRTGRETGQVLVPGGPLEFVLTRDGKTLYVEGGDSALYAVDAATGRVERRVPAPVALLANSGAIALAPDGRTLYVTVPSGLDRFTVAS